MSPRSIARISTPQLSRAPACFVLPASVRASAISGRCVHACVPECGSRSLRRLGVGDSEMIRFAAGPSPALAAVATSAAAWGCFSRTPAWPGEDAFSGLGRVRGGAWASGDLSISRAVLQTLTLVVHLVSEPCGPHLEL